MAGGKKQHPIDPLKLIDRYCSKNLGYISTRGFSEPNREYKLKYNIILNK